MELLLFLTDQCRCRLQLCDDAGPADAVDVIMLHAMTWQCRRIVDAVCVAMLHLHCEGNADDTSMLSAFADNASPPSRGKCRRHVDAVRFCRQCFTSFAREMPTTRRCCLLHAAMLHLLREGNADDTSMLTAQRVNASSREMTSIS